MSVVAALVVDAPRPIPPLYSLLGAPITDATPPQDEHFTAGLELIGYPELDAMGTWPLCPPDASSAMGAKHTGGLAMPDHFNALTIYLGLVCTTRSLSPDELDARAQAAFAAYEHYFIERQVFNGYYDPSIPHLSDSNATVLASGVAQKVPEALGLLETEIAKTGRAGVIHCSPNLATHAASYGEGLFNKVGNHLETMLGTTVIPGQGYHEGTAPVGEAGNAGTAEWMYASTPFLIRRGSLYVPPWDPAAVNREQNTVTVWTERDYVYAWDQTLQAAVKVDRAT